MGAYNQFDWLEENFQTNRKFVIFDHIYGGSKTDFLKPESFTDEWTPEFSHEYFDIIDRYRDSLMLEVGAHDHFESLRLDVDDQGNLYRPLLIVTGVSPNHG